jgi:energy-coupling factor transporter transmembrane protein EcfT
MISWWIVVLIIIYVSVGSALGIFFIAEDGGNWIYNIFSFLVLYLFWPFFIIWFFLQEIIYSNTIRGWIERRKEKKRLKKEDDDYDEQYDEERLLRLGIKDTSDIWSTEER